MLLMVGRVDAADEMLLPVGGEVGMQLKHRALGSFCICAINLDLIVALRVKKVGSRESKQEHD
jgi:hypothetical protein